MSSGQQQADVDGYLARLGMARPLAADLETLRRLTLAHLVAVPFENLDITLGQRIDLDERKLVEKVVLRRRGGFCYELNGAFAWLLTSLGYRVSRLQGGVRRESGKGYGPAFDHLVLQVDLEEPWLVDVGFGDGPIAPLRLSTEEPQKDGRREWRIARDGDARVVEQKTAAGFKALYRFESGAHPLDAFAGMCAWHQTSPESYFRRGRVCSITTPNGRVTLAEGRLVITEGGSVRSMVIGEGDRDVILHAHFGVKL